MDKMANTAVRNVHRYKYIRECRKRDLPIQKLAIVYIDNLGCLLHKERIAKSALYSSAKECIEFYEAGDVLKFNEARNKLSDAIRKAEEME